MTKGHIQPGEVIKKANGCQGKNARGQRLSVPVQARKYHEKISKNVLTLELVRC